MIQIRHTQETRPVYNQIYRGDAINQMDSFFIWILRLLQAKSGARLLDVSTGRGQMVHLARQRGIDAIGIDFSTTACQSLRAKRRVEFSAAMDNDCPLQRSLLISSPISVALSILNRWNKGSAKWRVS